MKQILTKVTSGEDAALFAARAVEEGASDGCQTILFHLYSGIGDYDILNRVTRALARQAPQALIVGTFSAGEIANGKLMEQGILVSAMLFERTDVRKMSFADIQGHEVERGRQIAQAIDAIPQIKGVEFLLPGTEFNTMALLKEVSRCRRQVQIFGGYAGGHQLTCTDHFVFDQEGIHHDHILMITYAGEDFHLDVDKSAGWSTLGMPFQVTKADGNWLVEVDDEPAVELYERYLQIPREAPTFAEETFEFPLMVMEDGEEILRHTMSVDERGALNTAGYVTDGMDIYLSYGNPTDIVDKVNQRLEKIAAFQPQAILLYSCSVRKSFWENYVNMEMEPFEQIAKTAGFFTWGEIRREPKTAHMLEYNITLLSIAMREGDPPHTPAPSVRVNDSVLQGQASLIQRLAKLVSATTGELQKAYEDLSGMNEQLRVMAEHDSLTSLYNRGKIESLIYRALEQAPDGPVSLVMLDIDHFKLINDTYGHAAGDSALTVIGRFLQEAAASCGEGGAAGRWGGEEFFLLLPGLGLEEARALAEGLRKTIEDYDFPEVRHVTASMGVRVCAGSEVRKKIFSQLDDALYRAKANGRNQVVCCETI